jgi:hypothetical protein
MRRTFALVACLAVGTSCVAAGCGDMAQPDPRFEQALEAAAAKGSSIRLDQLTDFNWDRVRLFRDVWKGSEINSEVGARVMDDDAYQDEDMALWVFFYEGQVVRAIKTGNRSVVGDPPAEGAEVWLVPWVGHPGWLAFASSPAPIGTPAAKSGTRGAPPAWPSRLLRLE